MKKATVFFILFLGLSAWADSLDTAREFLRELFPEISSETVLSPGPGAARYKVRVALSARAVSKRVRRASSFNDRFYRGVRVTKVYRSKGVLRFKTVDRAGRPVGDFAVRPDGKSAWLFFYPAKPIKPLKYKVFLF